ncbi:PD-(D/E)XK nuclease family protein [Paracoccus sp. MKU1]|uniref:PD-(D/E)XK nuclease family protein n=1 Tax=Paracoccus sp. MKU1 TaxID=1745182 RepID=UPI0009E7D080|nr:PD-(D/E)XK nuclease family protein [Paracoccus sp. MKU1]
MVGKNDIAAKEDLIDFFASYGAVHTVNINAIDLSQKLTAFFNEIPILITDSKRAEKRARAATDLSNFFHAVQTPLKIEIECGGFLDIWSIVGLNGYEVRTARVLAGLWNYDFGGRVSRAFITSYLEGAIPKQNWEDELRRGYKIYTEVNPLGDEADRVDLIVETDKFLVGIEIKIRAGLGERQLERYALALNARATHIGKCSFLILLAPYKTEDSGIYLSTWKDVAASARSAISCSSDNQAIVNHIINRFGDYVSKH